MNHLKTSTRWMTVALFATAMAWVESAVVYYLRTMVDRIDPHQPNPLPLIGGLGPVELVREAATMVMLLMVGILAGRTWRSRWGYAAIAFGIWDIFYYVFLKAMCGWPHSVLDWDILFLLPMPWWGPVLAPVLIALLMIIWGTLACSEQALKGAISSAWGVWAISFTGMLLGLYVFMSDALRVYNQGMDAVRNVLPMHFNWPLFSLALLFISAPILRILWIRTKPDRTIESRISEAQPLESRSPAYASGPPEVMSLGIGNTAVEE